MELKNIFKKQLSSKIEKALPETLKCSMVKATETINELSTIQQEKSVFMARTNYILPKDIEQDIEKGISLSKCKKKLKTKKGFSVLDSKELDNLIWNANSRICNERMAKEFENDFQYYQLQPHSEAPCPICMEKSEEIFEFKNRKIKENFPPLHDGCKCTIRVFVPDRDKWIQDYERKHKL